MSTSNAGKIRTLGLEAMVAIALMVAIAWTVIAIAERLP